MLWEQMVPTLVVNCLDIFTTAVDPRPCVDKLGRAVSESLGGLDGWEGQSVEWKVKLELWQVNLLAYFLEKL